MSDNGLNTRQVRIFYAVLVGLLLVFQEALSRFIFPLPEIANFNRVNYSMMLQSAGDGEVQPLANAAFSWASDPDGAEFIHRLNLYGFRDVTWPMEAGGRVMFVGDSFVEGFMAADDETIPKAFETAAAKNGEQVATINLGTGAGGIEDYLALIRDAVPIFRPRTVVLVLYANDFTDSTAGAKLLDDGGEMVRNRRYLPRLFSVVSRLAKGETVATRWLKEPFVFLPDADSPRSPLNDPAFARQAGEIVAPDILAAMKAGRFNPFVVNEYSNYKSFFTRPAQLEELIGRTRGFVTAHGADLLVVHIPHRAQVSDHYLQYLARYDENKQPSSLTGDEYQLHPRTLALECARLGVPLLDMAPLLRDREAAGQHMYWNYDEHMNAAGYRLVGEQVYLHWNSPGKPAGGAGGSP